MLNQKIGKCLVVLIFLMLLVFSIDESYVESAGSVQDEAGENADIGQEKMTTGSDSTEQNEALGNAGTGQDEMTAESDGTGLKKIEKSSDTGQNKKIKKVSLKKDELLTIIDDLNTDEKEFYSSSEELLNSKEVKKVKKIQEALYENGSRASFLLVDLNSGEVFSSGTEHIYYGASVLKGPFVVAVNKYDPDSVNDYIKEMMTYAIEMSDNQCYDNLRMTYGVDVLAKLVEDTGASQTVVDAYNWYPDMTVKDLAKLWVGMYWYFFEETNENTEWCISIFENSFQSFISSSLCEEYTVYSKAGWICDEFDIARNDGGIVMDEEDPYILVIMSEAFNDYEKLEELAGALDKVHEKMIQ